MKALSISLFLLINLFGFSQDQKKCSRLYGQIETGFVRHWGIGVNAHWFSHLATSFSYSSTRFRRDPFYVSLNASLLPVGNANKLFDRANKFNFLVGFSTKTSGPVNLSFLLGPSYIKHDVYSNIEIITTNNGKSFSYDRDMIPTLGYAIRADLAVAFSKRFGVNVGFDSCFNEQREYWRIVLGLNFGIVRNRSI